MLKKIALAITLLLSFPLMSKETCPLELKGHGLCAQVSWKLGPQYGAYSTALIKYWKKGKSNQLVDPKSNIEVYPWMIMEGMEHGASKVEIKKLDQGTFEVSKIQFLKMKGHWELRFKKPGANSKKSYLAKTKIYFK
ncbi:MAG: FixH family protein [Bdellovibrionota bacterium]|nr:FixH family protein [Bdellovibrionota bacterium]